MKKAFAFQSKLNTHDVISTLFCCNVSNTIQYLNSWSQCSLLFMLLPSWNLQICTCRWILDTENGLAFKIISFVNFLRDTMCYEKMVLQPNVKKWSPGPACSSVTPHRIGGNPERKIKSTNVEQFINKERFRLPKTIIWQSKRLIRVHRLSFWHSIMQDSWLRAVSSGSTLFA